MIGIHVMPRNQNINKAILEKGKAAEAKANLLSQLLWDTYLILDHGEMQERLDMLDKLEKYFDEHGKPVNQ